MIKVNSKIKNYCNDCHHETWHNVLFVKTITGSSMVQNKLHYAVNRQTAAEIVMDYCIKARSFRRIFLF